MFDTLDSRRPRVAVASVRGRATLPETAAHELETVADVSYLATEQALTRTEAAAAFAEAEVVAFTPKVAPPVDEALLEDLSKLRGIAIYATGYDFLDLDLLDKYGVALSHLPEYSTTSVAEHALGMLLSLSRRIHLGNDRCRELVPMETSLRGFELAGRTLGIVGFGRIGSTLGQLGQALGMQVIAADPRRDRVEAAGVQHLPFNDVLQQADVVAVLCSAEHVCEPILGTAEIARMRPGAVLVNTSRPHLVDEEAVATAIRAGRLRGYAVDDAVFDPQKYGDLLTEGRIVQTGHSAWWSDEVLERGGAMWAEHIRRLALGSPIDVVSAAPLPDGAGSGNER
ncbi:MAG: NAD(P)-dependent oxidoreductase [Nocardiopsaceae bacterium]|nr:NAD(P)-dependent oxidoreductase [Nocardiopsaceae bacterium]